jgi:DNA polymerase-1
MIRLMNIEIVEISGFEADDIIWTLATRLGKEKDFEIDILTWDKDLYSLVAPNVRIYDTMKKKKFGPKETKEKFGIESNMIVDYLAIVWDSSDNIPWISGFWPEKAVKLINYVWWIGKIFQLVEEINTSKKNYTDLPEEVQFCFKWKTFEKLASSKEIAFLSKELATVKLDVPLENFDIEDFKFEKKKLVNENVIEFFEKYEFNSLVWEEKVVMKLQNWNDLDLKVHIIDNDENLAKLKESCLKEKELVLDTETTSLDIMDAELTWISIYLDDERIYYINRLHYWDRVSDEALKEFLSEILSSSLLIVWHNLKYDLEVLEMFLKNPHPNPLPRVEGTMQTSLF